MLCTHITSLGVGIYHRDHRVRADFTNPNLAAFSLDDESILIVGAPRPIAIAIA